MPEDETLECDIFCTFEFDEIAQSNDFDRSIPIGASNWKIIQCSGLDIVKPFSGCI